MRRCRLHEEVAMHQYRLAAFTAWLVFPGAAVCAAENGNGWSAQQAELDGLFSDLARPTLEGGARGGDTAARLRRTRACSECSFVGVSLRGLDLHDVDLRRAALLQV